MASRSDRASSSDRSTEAAPAWRRARGVGISQTVLVVSGPFGPNLAASDVGAALARGLQTGGALAVDVCPLPSVGAGSVQASEALTTDVRPLPGTGAGDEQPGAGAGALLDALDFDARMRSARAVVVATRRLQERALAGSVTFEVATRARQGGVPAYAVTGENALEPFDARILDLQLVLQAGSARALAAAGRRLAAIV